MQNLLNTPLASYPYILWRVLCAAVSCFSRLCYCKNPLFFSPIKVAFYTLLLSCCLSAGISSMNYTIAYANDTIEQLEAEALPSTEVPLEQVDAEAQKEAPLTQELSQDDWESLWHTRTQDLIALQQEANALRLQLPKLTNEVEESVDSARLSFRRLFALIQAKHTAPNDLVNLDAQLAIVSSTLQEQLDPVKEILTNFESKRKILQDLETDFAEQVLEHDSDSHGASSTEQASNNKALEQKYFSKLQQTEQRASVLHARLTSLLEPGIALLDRVETLRVTVKKTLPTLWRDHYLTPSAMLFDVAAWAEIPASLVEFTQSFLAHLWSELPSSLESWLGCILRFFFVVIPFIAILRTIRLKLEKSFAGTDITLDAIYAVRNALGWIGFGLALHFAAYASSQQGFGALIVPANVFLVWGQIGLAWSLCTFMNAEMQNVQKHSPFASFEYLVIISLILLFLSPPLPLLGLVWAISLGIILLMRYARSAQSEQIPAFERTMMKLETVILWSSLLVVVLGWGRLAMVLYMAFVALSVSIQLGIGLMSLIDTASERLPKEGSNAIIGGVVLGLAAPLVLLLVAGAIFLWVIAYPGGAYVLQHAVEFNVKLGAVSFDGLRILFILTAFYVTRSLNTVGTTFLAQLPIRLPRFDKSMVQPMQAALTYFLWGVFALYVLQALGVSMTNLAVIAGGLSVGIGFGMQTIVNNFISGLILIFGRSLQEGDIIDLDGTTSGVVRKVNIRATTVETFDSAVIFVPNSDLVSNRITNWTRNSLRVRRDVCVGVAYGSDVALVQKLLQEVASSQRNVLRIPAPAVIFNDFGASTLDFILRVWITDINVGISTMSEMRTQIDALFREHGIEIAFPQMDIHVRSAEGLHALRKEADVSMQAEDNTSIAQNNEFKE